MTHSAPLVAALDRMEVAVREALADDWGANAFETVLTQLQSARRALKNGSPPDELNALSGLGAQIQASQAAGVLGMTSLLEHETPILLRLLGNHLDSLRAT